VSSNPPYFPPRQKVGPANLGHHPGESCGHEFGFALLAKLPKGVLKVIQIHLARWRADSIQGYLLYYGPGVSSILPYTPIGELLSSPSGHCRPGDEVVVVGDSFAAPPIEGEAGLLWGPLL